MARKSRKNMPVAVAEPTDNLTAKAVLSMDKEAKPYQVGIYARLSFESEANKERDTVDTQIAYIREFINSQDDMVEVEVYADISVTGTTFERPEFDRMIQDIRAGRINTVITRDLSRLGRNYVEAGNYIETLWTRTQKADHETGAADNKLRLNTKHRKSARYSACFVVRGFQRGLPLGTRLCLQSVVCYTLCRRCCENAVATGEGKGI